MPRRRIAPAAALAAAGLLVAAAVAAPALARVAVGAPALARVRREARAGRSGPPVLPVFAGELAAPMMSYRGYVQRLLGTLSSQAAALVATTRAGELGPAESAWLSAHLTWLRIGQDDGAYGAFGELGRQIDGTAAGLVAGTASPGFTGFHRVELDLWARGDVTAAAADAARLQALIGALSRRRLGEELPTTIAGLASWTLRPHEILEDSLRDTLSGGDDYGSGTGLASVTANVSATREVLDLLAPLIDPRSPHLVGRARRQLVAVDAAVTETLRDGRWIAVSLLPRAQRERVDAAVGAALETLAPVGDLLQILGDE